MGAVGTFKDPLLGRKPALGGRKPVSQGAHAGFEGSAHSQMVDLRWVSGWYG